MKKCSFCKKFLEETGFSFYKGKLQSFCRSCQNAYSKEYRQKYKERCRKNLKEWREKKKESK